MINKNVKTRIICFALCLLLLIPSVISFVAIADSSSSSSQIEMEKGSGIIVSFGDSYSAGEGITPFFGQDKDPKEKVEDPDWLAHRSTKSWPSRLKLNGEKMVRGENWYFVAASGAETVHINGKFKKEYDYEGLEHYKELDPQIDIFKQLQTDGKTPEYITITMGGNDAKFSDVVSDALVSSVTDINLVSMKLASIWQDFYRDGGIRDKLIASYVDIYETAKTTFGKEPKIIVVGYPELINEKDNNVWFSDEVAKIVNESVRRFNDEIENIVNHCKTRNHMKICFVSVEEKFADHKAYSKDPYINKVDFFANSEDLDNSWGINPSAYSMHPNDKGAQVYADCVNAKIKELEKDEGASEWPEAKRSEELEVVLVMDTSGSMDGAPLDEAKNAAKNFVSTIVGESGASLGIVSYDTKGYKLSDFSRNQYSLERIIDNMHTGGSTNIQDGLSIAAGMLRESTAKRKLIVLMSDGLPNVGFTGERLIQYANQIKDEGVYIYALGFFQGMGYGVSSAESLMNQIASEGSYFNIGSSEQLKLFFGDISDELSGTKYIYIRIACPVDVTVEFNGQVLSSVGAKVSQRTEFGTLTFEDNPNGNSYSSDNRIKVLRLKEGEAYDVKIEGNGTGQMKYTIGFMNENGEYDDLREFEPIEITESTIIDTTAEYTKTSVLNVDSDGDGDYDKKIKVSGKTRAGEDDDEEYALNKKAKKIKNIVVIICVVAAGFTFVIFLIVVIRILVIKRSNKKIDKALASEAANAISETPTEEAPTEETPKEETHAEVSDDNVNQ